jgi:hypothetical protein
MRWPSTDHATGVGLGLASSRGLTGAIRGTLEPEETPGGGLTIAFRCRLFPGKPGSPGRRERDRDRIDPAPSRDHDGARAWHGAAATVSRPPATRRSRACHAPCRRAVQGAVATATGTRRRLQDPVPARRGHGSSRPDGQSRGDHVAWAKEAGA